jgi:uncharacterized protein YggE
MKRKLLIIAGAFALVALLTVQGLAQEAAVRGRLGRTVEPGGWLILTNGEKYLLLNSQQFQQEAWFREGAEVVATGVVKRDAITIYQEGTPFEARSLRPSGSENAGDKRNLTRVIVAGDSIVQAQPDTAILNISVVTQSKNALDAQSENARLSDAVIRALKAVAGAGAEIKTSGYVLTPQRVYKENQPPTISGYEARNSVTVTMSELSKVGAVIDAAAQAGANNVDNVAFTLRRDEAARNQALTEATREAIGKARVLAQALGGRVVRIIEVQEDGVTPRPIYQREMAMSDAKMSTPIEVGTLDISSRVQLIAEIETMQ